MTHDASRPRPRAVATGTGATLRTRWLGTVPYEEALAVQRGFHRDAVRGLEAGILPEDRLLLLEHPPTYTLGRNADPTHVLVSPESVGARLLEVDRGGDVTYHGPGQLVAYPLVTLADHRGRSVLDGGVVSNLGWVGLLESVLIRTLERFDVEANRRAGFPGVWVGAGRAKIAAIGVRVERGRTLHGIALNVDPDLAMFGHIVPCGITDAGVASMRSEGCAATMREVVDAFTDEFVAAWSPGRHERSDVVWRARDDGDTDLAPFSRGLGPGRVVDGSNSSGRTRANRTPVHLSGRLSGRLAEAGVTDAVSITDRKPSWMRARVRHDPAVMRTRRTVGELGLVTVCEEAGCPNLSECWSSGTATFMVNGERCTRKCGFCLVDTAKPTPPDPGEPDRVAQAVEEMGLRFAVVTTVARDDLADEGAGQVAATVEAIRARCPATSVEVLISDCRGRPQALETIFRTRPDVCNHNIETVARLQRAVRPSAGYARSLSVLARSVDAGLTTKSGLVVGMGETIDEIAATLADLAAVGVSIVTIGQYLRPTSHHLPVTRWWAPADFAEFKRIGEDLGISHVESSPFTRSSYHAESAAAALSPDSSAAGV